MQSYKKLMSRRQVTFLNTHTDTHTADNCHRTSPHSYTSYNLSGLLLLYLLYFPTRLCGSNLCAANRDYVYECVLYSYLQTEEESKLRAQVSDLGKELASENSRTTELQKALEQRQESLTKLQSDLYGKESEVSAMRQDLKVGLCRKGWRSRD